MLTAFGQVQAQVLLTSGFETWSGSHHPQGWVGVKTSIDTTTGIIKNTTNFHGGATSVQLVNATTSHKRFTTTGLSVETGVFYEISYWVRGHGSIRCGCTDLTNYSSYVPSAYHAINSGTWAQYKDTVVGPGTNVAGEFIFSVLSTNADLDHLQVDDVTITKLAVTIPTVSIYDIQYTTAIPEDSPYAGEMVNTGGIVTAANSSFYVLQSHVGPWNGIEIYDNTHAVTIGDSVTLTGMVSEYNGLTEIGGVFNFVIVSSGNTLPGPDVVPPVVINSEAYECVFAKLENVLCTDTTAGNGMFRVFDGNDTTYVDDVFYHFTATPGVHYDITGIGYYSYGLYKLLPRSAADVTINTTSIEETNSIEVAMYPNPVVNELNLFVNGQVDMIRVTDMTGNMVISQNTNGLNNLTIDFSAIRTGNYVVSMMKDGEIVARQIVVKQ